MTPNRTNIHVNPFCQLLDCHAALFAQELKLLINLWGVIL